MYFSMISNKTSTPIPVRALPAISGTQVPSSNADTKAFLNSSCVNSSPLKYFSIKSSSVCATTSQISSNTTLTSSTLSSGIGTSLNSKPLYSKACLSITSITPLKSSPSPSVKVNGMIFLPNLSCKSLTHLLKLAFSLSILLTNIILGRSIDSV